MMNNYSKKQNIIEEFKHFILEIEETSPEIYSIFKTHFLKDVQINEYCNILENIFSGNHKDTYSYFVIKSFMHPRDMDVINFCINNNKSKFPMKNNMCSIIDSCYYMLSPTEYILNDDLRTRRFILDYSSIFSGTSFDISKFVTLYHNIGSFFILKNICVEYFIDNYNDFYKLALAWYAYCLKNIFDIFSSNIHVSYIESNKKTCIISDEYIPYKIIKNFNIQRISDYCKYIKINRVYERG